MTNKPFAPACERNKTHILEKLKPIFSKVKTVLEIGSGTGQHAIYFAQNLPHINWQTSDLAENHEGINSWIKDSNLENILKPLLLDVNRETWPITQAEAIFSANVLHIISSIEVQKMFSGIGKIAKKDSTLCVYGPFNYNGCYTSQSNASFDEYLKEKFPGGGIKDFETINSLAQEQGFQLQEDHKMPANNRFLHWTKAD